MKVFISFLLGFLLSLVILGGVGFWLLFSSGSKGTNSSTLISIPTTTNEKMVNITMVVKVPELLKDAINKTATLEFRALAMHANNFFSVRVSLPGNKLMETNQINVQVPLAKYSELMAGSEAGEFFSNLEVCVGPIEVDPMCVRNGRYELVANAAIKPQKAMQAGDTLNLGTVYFSRKAVRGTGKSPMTCDKVGTITGKVVATDEFLANAPKGGRTLLVLLPQDQRLVPDDFDRFVVYVKEYTPAKEVAFSFPSSRFGRPDYLRGYVSFCKPGESDNACIKKTFATSWEKSANTGMPLVFAGLKAPHCSDRGPLVAYLHWYPLRNALVPAAGVLAHGRNPKLPLEIIEGQLVP